MKSFLLAVLVVVSGTVHGDPLDEDYGYVEVRPGAHMFWVAYHTELGADWTQYPLILWLQGGPGASGVGYGNFWELGPYDIEGNLRPGRWTQKANLMFVDNPVGTGYSYVDDLDLLCTDNEQIADDLVTLLTSVFTDYPEMQGMPFFVYAESYGGKMTADFAIALDAAISDGTINCNFQGIAMGDSWISPMDSVNTWGSFLYSMGFVNEDGQATIDNSAAQTQGAVDNENWGAATIRWEATEAVVLSVTDGVDFYNVLVEDSGVYDFFSDEIYKEKYSHMDPAIFALYARHVMHGSKETRDALDDYMNGPQADAWGIPDGVVWGGQSGEVFDYLSDDFMKPVTTSVEYLLANTNIHVAVYTGDLDLICDTPGTYLWISNLDYPQKPGYLGTSREALTISAYPNNAAYVQRYERFSVFTILRSGHMVPIDAPEMCLDMIDMITAYGAEASSSRKQEEPKNKVSIVHSKTEALKSKKSKELQKKEQAEKVKETVERKENVKEMKEQVEKAKEIVEKKKENVKEKKEQLKTNLVEKVEQPNDEKKVIEEKEQVKIAQADTAEQVKEQTNEQKAATDKRENVKEKAEQVKEKTNEEKAVTDKREHVKKTKEQIKEKKLTEKSSLDEKKKQAELIKEHLKHPSEDRKHKKNLPEEMKKKITAPKKVPEQKEVKKQEEETEKTTLEKVAMKDKPLKEKKIQESNSEKQQKKTEAEFDPSILENWEEIEVDKDVLKALKEKLRKERRNPHIKTAAKLHYHKVDPKKIAKS